MRQYVVLPINHFMLPTKPKGHTQSILIYQGVHCCTKVCKLVLRTYRLVIQPESSGCTQSCTVIISGMNCWCSCNESSVSKCVKF